MSSRAFRLLSCALFALSALSVQAAVLAGKISFPSAELPLMTVVARDTGNGTLVRLETKAGQTRYSMNVPAGNYVVFAVPHEPASPARGEQPLRGAYTAYSVCARDTAQLLAGRCQTGPLMEVKLATNDSRQDVDIDDWYLPDALVASLQLSAARPSQNPMRTSEPIQEFEPRFDAYPATAAEPVRLRAADFSTAPAAVQRYRTQIERAATKGPVFAGRVGVARWACGAQCENWALVDLVSGRVVWIADGVLQPVRRNLPCQAETLEYRIDSRLLRVRRFDGKRVTTQHFLWNDDTQKLEEAVAIAVPAQQFCAGGVAR